MLKTLKKAAILSVSALAITAAPMLPGSLDSQFLPDSGAYAGEKGGGNGGGNGGGGENGNSGDHGNSGGNGGGNSNSHAGGNGNAHKAKSTDTASVEDVDAATKERNIRAQLAGLNSLQRNVNGLMNSSDPRMEQIREFVQAGADLEIALADLAAAQTALEEAEAAYAALIADLGLAAYDGSPDAYADTSPEGLQQRLDDLNALALAVDDPNYAAWQAEITALDAAIAEVSASEELTALAAAETAVADAEVAANEAVEGTGDEDLTEALLLAANDNRVAEYGDDYVTDEILEWAKSVLGVGDYDGTIDAYLAQ